MMHARSTLGRALLGVLVLAVATLPGAGLAGTCETTAVFQNYPCTALDDACLEILDGQASRLKVSNLGSSGCDGFSVDLGDVSGPEIPKCEFRIAPVDLSSPNSSLTGTLRGQIEGLPADSVIVEIEAISDGNNVDVNVDFSAFGSQTQTVEVYNDGVLVHTSSGSTGPAVQIATARLQDSWWPVAVDMECRPIGDVVILCLDSLDDLVDIFVPSTGTTIPGDEVRVLAENRQRMPDFFSSGELMAGGIAEFEVLDMVIDGTPIDPCQVAASPDTEVLYVNGSQGGDDGPYDVQANAGELVWAAVLLPNSGGNGKFVMHANYGDPTPLTVTTLPASIGTMCFPMLLSSGGSPDAVWNNIGKESAVGASQYFDGSSISDPAKAPVIFLQLNSGDDTYLPVGTRVTFQGVIVDPAAASPKSVGTTNGVTLQIL